MKVDKKTFKELKQQDGGMFGHEYKCMGKIKNLSYLQDCTVEIRQKGIYLDVSATWKEIFPIEILEDVEHGADTVKMFFKNDGSREIILSNNSNMNGLFNALRKKLNLSTEELKIRKVEHIVKNTSSEKKVEDKVVCCPKCGSTSITANKKGLSLAKGAAGVFVAGAIGVVAAGHGKNKVIITCLNCGHQWKAGKK